MRRMLVVVVALCVTAGTAMAAFDLQALGGVPGWYQNMTIHGGAYIGGIYGEVGLYHWQFGAGDHGGAGTQGFCIEMQTSDPAYHQYSLLALEDAPVTQGPGGNPMGLTKADYIRELWTLHYNDVTDATTAAAFQAAVWEIIYETSAWDVTSGPSFWIDSAGSVGSTANDWLGDLTGNGPHANLIALSSPEYQDFVTTIPAPAAVVLGALGLGLIGWLKRRLA